MSIERRWYRVELRAEGRVRSLGRLPDVTPHAATLAPFASQLVRAGVGGELVLIDEATGSEVARQNLKRGPRRAPTRNCPPDRPRRRLVHVEIREDEPDETGRLQTSCA
jgi:hypothetical protein